MKVEKECNNSTAEEQEPRDMVSVWVGKVLLATKVGFPSVHEP